VKFLKSQSIKNEKSNNGMNAFRDEIDAIDQQLVDILVERMALSKEIAEYKQANNLAIRDRHREIELIESRTEHIKDPVVKQALAEVLESVLKASRDIQQNIHDE